MKKKNVSRHGVSNFHTYIAHANWFLVILVHAAEVAASAHHVLYSDSLFTSGLQIIIIWFICE